MIYIPLEYGHCSTSESETLGQLFVYFILLGLRQKQVFNSQSPIQRDIWIDEVGLASLKAMTFEGLRIIDERTLDCKKGL